MPALIEPLSSGPRKAVFSQFAKTHGYEEQALQPSCWGPPGTAPGVGPAWHVPDGQSGICTGEKRHLLRHFMLKMIILLRQTRDKHRKS